MPPVYSSACGKPLIGLVGCPHPPALQPPRPLQQAEAQLCFTRCLGVLFALESVSKACRVRLGRKAAPPQCAPPLSAEQRLSAPGARLTQAVRGGGVIRPPYPVAEGDLRTPLASLLPTLRSIGTSAQDAGQLLHLPVLGRLCGPRGRGRGLLPVLVSVAGPGRAVLGEGSVCCGSPPPSSPACARTPRTGAGGHVGSLSPLEHSTSAPRLPRAFGVALASSGRRRVWHVPEGGPEASRPLASRSRLPRRAPSGPPRGPSLRRSPAVAVGAGRGRVQAKVGSRFWVLASPQKSLNEGLRVAGPLLRTPQLCRQASAAFPRGGRLRGVGSTEGQMLASA